MGLTERHQQELFAIVSLLVGVFVALTFLPWDITGAAGRSAGRFLWTYLGVGAALIPLFGVALSLAWFRRLRGLTARRVGVLFGGLILLVPFAIAVLTGARDTADFPANYEAWKLGQRLVGIVPALTVWALSSLIGTAGAVIVGLLGLSALTIYSLDWHPFQRLERHPAAPAAPAPYGGDEGRWGAVEGDVSGAEVRKVGKSKRSILPSFRRSALGTGGEAGLDQLPPIGLLAQPAEDRVGGAEEEISRLGDVLIDTLGTFRVEGKIVGRTTGPVVTQYEVAPAPGVKVGRIASLADDLALAMRAQSIRIVAPIPGKGAVGVEVPNPTPRMVMIRELVDTREWDRTTGVLPIALGRNLEGNAIIPDLAQMPHLLIAGATGSGKSVCINAIITSLIYRYTPQRLRMLMIDPKMVELSIYNALPHLRHPVVTDNRHAAQALKWVMIEMGRRYELFHANGARNMYDFNRFVAEGRALVDVNGKGEKGKGKGSDPEKTFPGSPFPFPPDGSAGAYDEGPLPYIVVVVDELADLMMTVQSEVEKPLAILAQKARATGIHLVLSTQRPSVNVITGLIKANFPSRIAFRVASKVDSRTILDQNGAEALLGNGDLLFLPPGKSEPIRVQGAFISTAETEAVTGWYRELAAVKEAELEEENILAVVEAMEAEEQGAGARGEMGEQDPLFREAAEVCISNQLGSTSLLQRKLRIGYGRAARIVDQLHESGILGPPDGSRPREVLIGMDEVDDYCR